MPAYKSISARQPAQNAPISSTARGWHYYYETVDPQVRHPRNPSGNCETTSRIESHHNAATTPSPGRKHANPSELPTRSTTEATRPRSWVRLPLAKSLGQKCMVLRPAGQARLWATTALFRSKLVLVQGRPARRGAHGQSVQEGRRNDVVLLGRPQHLSITFVINTIHHKERRKGQVGWGLERCLV